MSLFKIGAFYSPRRAEEGLVNNYYLSGENKKTMKIFEEFQKLS